MIPGVLTKGKYVSGTLSQGDWSLIVLFSIQKRL